MLAGQRRISEGKVIIKTKLEGDCIIQKDNLNDQVTRIMDLREKGIREALIKAGWVPPCKKQTGGIKDD